MPNRQHMHRQEIKPSCCPQKAANPNLQACSFTPCVQLTNNIPEFSKAVAFILFAHQQLCLSHSQPVGTSHEDTNLCETYLNLACRSAAETETKPGSSGNGAVPSLQRADSDREARRAVAAKISAARALARKLSEEKQAAVTAAKLAADQSMDEAELDR